MLTARLFGLFSLSDGPRTFALPTDKSRALLAFLLVSQQPQPRSRLAALLWPDLPERRGLHNLTNALLALRRVAVESDHELLVDTPTTVALNPAAISCDLYQADLLYRQSLNHQHRDAERCSACAVRGSRLLELIGDPFLFELELPGCDEFTDWLAVQRELWFERSVELRRRQAVQLRYRGRLAEARAQLLTVLRSEPWREELFREVATLSAELGERSTALRQYQRGVETLRRHLNADPEPAGIAFAAALAANRFQPREATWQRIPATQTPFFGRNAELQQVLDLLTDRQVRLITLLGPGGAGKTYLATVAAELAVPTFDAVVFVPLSESQSTADAVLRIAGAVELELTPHASPLQQLLRRFNEGSWLLVLDNLEQLPDADQLLNQLLDAAGEITLLTTSRRALDLHRERLFAINGFHLPGDETAAPAVDDALAFVLRRAAEVLPDQDLQSSRDELLALCRLTAGLPLALELAVAQLRRHSAADLLKDVQSELAVLQRQSPDLPERQRNISIVFAQNWRTLRRDLQLLLAELTICRSPFSDATAAAVSAVTDVHPLLTELHNLGLVLGAPEQRHDLHPLLRQFVEQSAAATTAIEPTTLAAARQRHQHHFLGLLTTDALRRPDQSTLPFIQQHAAQFSDIRAALQFAAQQQDTAALIAALPGLQQFCMFLGWYELGLQLIREATEQIAVTDAPAAAGLLLRAGILALHAGRREYLDPLITQALAWHRDAVTEIQAGSLTATVKTELRDFSGAIAEFEQLRARRVALPPDVAAYLVYSHSRVLMIAGRLAEAETAALESRELALAAGDVRTIALVDSSLAQIPARAGDNLRALPRFEQALQSGRRLGLSFVLWITLGNYAHTLAYAGRDPAYARALLTEWEAMTRAAHDEFRLALLLAGTVTTYLKLGDVDRAELQLCSSLPLIHRIPHPELNRLLLEAVSQLGRERGLSEITTEALRIQLGHPETQPATRELARQQLDPALEPYDEPVEALNQRIRNLFFAVAAAFNVPLS
jgi:DNA-binding SARP family transcriptional activator/predicted ATPase